MAFRPILLMVLATLGMPSVASAQSVVVSGDPGLLAVGTATAGLEPDPARDATTTYAVTTTAPNQKIMARLDAYVVVVEEGRTTQREMKDVIGLLGAQRLAGVILNKYRGGLVSEGYGVDSYYAAGYYSESKGRDPEA